MAFDELYIPGTLYPEDEEGKAKYTIDELNKISKYSSAVSEYISAIGPGVGEANTSSNAGSGQGLALPKAGVNLPFRSLVAGNNVTITPGTDTLTIASTGGGTTDHSQLTNRDLPDAHPPFAGPGTTGYVPDPVTGQNYYLKDDGTFAPTPVSPIGGVFLNYRFDSDTVPPPGDGRVSVNNIDQIIATELYISVLTEPGNDVTFLLNTIKQGQFIGVWETTGQRETIYYQAIGDAVNNGTYFTIPIAHISGEGGLDNNAPSQVFFIDDPFEKLPRGGDPGQVLTKVTATDYDTEWRTPSGGGGDGFWTANGDNIYNNNVGNVGIGITDPVAKLEIDNAVRISDDGSQGANSLQFVKYVEADGAIFGTLNIVSQAIIPGETLPTWGGRLRAGVTGPWAPDSTPTNLYWEQKTQIPWEIDADGCTILTNNSSGNTAQMQFKARPTGFSGTLEWLDSADDARIQMSYSPVNEFIIRSGANRGAMYDSFRFQPFGAIIHSGKRLSQGGIVTSQIQPVSNRWYRISVLPPTNSGHYNEFICGIPDRHVLFHVKHYKTTGINDEAGGGGVAEITCFGTYNYSDYHPYNWRISASNFANTNSTLDIQFPAAGTPEARFWYYMPLNSLGLQEDDFPTHYFQDIGTGSINGEIVIMGNGVGAGFNMNKAVIYEVARQAWYRTFDGTTGVISTTNG